MSRSNRNGEQQNERDVEMNDDDESLSDLAPTSEVSIDNVRFPPPRHSIRNSDFWTLLLTGSALSAGGVAALAYSVRNFEHTTGWALMFTSTTFAGVYLVARSLHRAYFRNLFNSPFNQQTGESRDFEAQRYRELLDRHLGPRLELPLSWITSETGSFPPSPAVSNVSSDILQVERPDYRPQSTDLSFRQKQEDRAKKYQKFVKKGWTSAPDMLQRQRSVNASKDENEKKDEKDEVAMNGEEKDEIEDEKEKKV